MKGSLEAMSYKADKLPFLFYNDLENTQKIMDMQEIAAYQLPELRERHLPEACREEVCGLLNEIYGYEQFRELEIYDDLFKGKERLSISQGQLIEHVIREAEKVLEPDARPDNILLTAPTGSGKSLLFQLPAEYLGRKHGWLTLVVSPLKALIVDQVESLQDLGYTRVAYASSDLSPEQKLEVYRQVREGEVDLFYLSPELLLSYDIRHFVGDRHIGLVVVDEAHTVTTWGKEFRVDYWFLGRYLAGLKQTLGYDFPLFALTATAVWNPAGDNDMVFETIRSLQMAPCVLYIGTVKRRNIGFDIRQLEIEEGETYDKSWMPSRKEANGSSWPPRRSAWAWTSATSTVFITLPPPARLSTTFRR